MFRTGGFLLVFGMLLLSLGCGGDSGMGTVTGKVTLGGEPLKNAEILFIPENGGRESIAYTDENGEYELEHPPKQMGALVGKHKVKISTFRASDSKVTAEERVPAQYNVNTTLIKEVKSGSNEINFELKKEGEIYQPRPDSEGGVGPGGNAPPPSCSDELDEGSWTP